MDGYEQESVREAPVFGFLFLSRRQSLLCCGRRRKRNALRAQRLTPHKFLYFLFLDSGSHKHKRTRNRAWVRKKKKEILWRCNFSFSSGCSLERWAAGHWALNSLYGAQWKRKSLAWMLMWHVDVFDPTATSCILYASIPAVTMRYALLFIYYPAIKWTFINYIFYWNGRIIEK